MSRRRTSLLLVIAAAAAFAATACGDETPIGAPGCRDDSTIIVAQSVPDAVLIPCFDELPGGWAVGEVDIGESGTTVSLDSDRAGDKAATLSYRESCDVSGLGQLPSERDDIQIHESIRELADGLDADRLFVFEGGCVTVHFLFDAFDDTAHAEALLGVLSFVERSDVNTALRDASWHFRV